ncbi:MAG TPA: SMC family ATPase, partial [Anaerolineales bacterium]|nr:SMC family ATPase [Anaerolineales bacterium]
MIPTYLRISGFLSYRDAVELDFNSFDVACISGHNGAGKSSLLDAITWSLFGEARGKSNDIINLHPDVRAAEVIFTFMLEQNTYRVQRILPRNKSTVLEFQVQNGETWKPLTEKTTRDTQARIEQILRLDYDTFVNASFFLQGKADQFTQQNSSKRKDVLGNILGLEIWEHYRIRAAEKRKVIEREVDEIDGRIREINAELSEEVSRKIKLAELEASLRQLTSARSAQETVLENIRKNAGLLDEQRKLIAALSAGLERAQTALETLETRLSLKEAERDTYARLVDRAQEIESSYKAWQKSRKELEEWDKVAVKFHEHERERTPLLEQIAVEKARLDEERRTLLIEEESIKDQQTSIDSLKLEIEKAEGLLKETEIKIAERGALEITRNTNRERQAELRVENDTLKVEMNQLKERIDTLKSAKGASCPLCGQALSNQHRKSTLRQLEEDGKERGDRFRANQKETNDLAGQTSTLESQIAGLLSAENERIRFTSEISQRATRLESLQTLSKEWESAGKKRLKELEKLLENRRYAVDEQKQLARLDKELAKLGYDASTHDEAREKESELRAAEEEFSNLKAASEVSRQIQGEISNLRSEIGNRKSEIINLETDYQTAKKNL